MRLVRRPTRLLGFAALLVPALLLAHAGLRRSDPKANASLRVAPDTARLWFTERPELALTTLLLVRGADTVALAPVVAIGDSAVGAALPPLAAGRWAILWRTTSADGHPRTGRIPFTVTEGVATAAAASGAAADAPPAPDAGGSASVDATSGVDGGVGASARGDTPELAWPYVAVRWLTWLALFLVVGGFLARATVLPGSVTGARALDRESGARLSERARHVAALASILLVVAVILRLGMQWWALGLPTPAPIFATSWGRAWVAQLAGALALAAATRRATWGVGSGGWALAALPLLLVVVGLAATGHAAASGHRAMVWILADALHLAAAASWVGTLLVLAFASAGARPLDRAALGVLFTRFTPVALGGAAVASLAGLALGYAHVGSLEALTSTDYGTFLIRKVVMVGLVAALGFVNWRIAIPRLSRGEGSALTVRLESILAVAILALTAVLVALPAPAAG